jgi:serine/threonine-protein kinase
MGVAYQARDRQLGRTVALKFLRAATPERVLRLLTEARAQARIDHPGVCKVYEAGEVEGHPYIAMQLVPGRQLKVAAADLSLPEKVLVMKDVALAIHAAHRIGILHRDLKPSNILVERLEDGAWVPVVMDFGLARDMDADRGLTETGDVLGTPSYMSPEQARGQVHTLDRRTDVYSLGATLYDLLCGRPPFTDSTMALVLSRLLHEEPPPPRRLVPGLPEDLETIVLKCLHKDPAQRYPSAKALAEDLGRYLDGEPILARRPGLLYRLRRRAAKHRLLVQVSAASLLLILGLAGVSLRNGLLVRRERQQASERARLAQRIGQEVKDIEWFLRAAYAAPLHDTTREVELVRERMARIAAPAAPLASESQAAVHYALGRGHLALHDLDPAHRELLRAEALGLDLPELHYALGRVLGELYHRAHEELRRRPDPSARAAEEQRIDKDYLQPALRWLERSRGLDLESPAYLDGLIAFYRRQYDRAEESAARAARDAPWMYEAHKLAADVALARATDALEHGDYAPARQRFERALASYRQAAEHGRSDASLFEALAEAWIERSELDRRQGQPRDEALGRALQASETAIQAAPRRAAGYTKKALTLIQRITTIGIAARAPELGPLFEEWLATATRAVELDPGDATAYDALGFGVYLRGWYEYKRGGDPDPWWDQALQHLSRALALRPRFPWALNDLGRVHEWRAGLLEQRGQDPMPEYTAAVRRYEQAVESEPRYIFGHTNLVNAHNSIADHLASHGLDPEDELRQAEAAAAHCLSVDKNNSTALIYLAVSEIVRAQYRLDAGQDPRPALGRALAQLERARAVAPASSFNATRRAWVYHLRAAWEVAAGQDPGPALVQGRAALLEAGRASAACADCLLLAARLDLVDAAWAQHEGRPSLPLLERALATALRRVSMDATPDAHQELARAYWRLGEARRPRALASEIAQGLDQVTRALAKSPDLAHVHAIRGGLLLLRAQNAPQPTERRAAAEEARAALSRAFGIDPLLRRTYGKLFEQADQWTRGGPVADAAPPGDEGRGRATGSAPTPAPRR